MLIAQILPHVEPLRSGALNIMADYSIVRTLHLIGHGILLHDVRGMHADVLRVSDVRVMHKL